LKKSKLFLIFSLFIVVIMLATLMACSKTTTTTPVTSSSTTSTSQSTTTASSKYGGTLRIIPNLGWNPLASIGYPPEMTYIGAADLLPCIERLVRIDNKGAPMPFLAQTWTVAPDKSSLTLGLKKGVKFHDGSDFNAEVVKWNLDNQIAVQGGGTQSWTSVDVVDDYTVRINLKNWVNDIYSTLASATGYIISEASFDKNGIDWVRTHPVGTGPFKFQSYQQDVSLKLTRFDNYWQKDAQGNQLPYLDGIEYDFISDLNTSYVTMTSGGADTWQVMDAHSVKQMKDAGFRINYVTDGAGLLWADSRDPNSPFSNLQVRQAVDYAIDRQGIVDSIGFGVWVPCYQCCSEGISAYVPGLQREYNVDTAKALMAQAGYANGFHTQIVAGSDFSPEVGAALQQNLAAIGITADVNIVEMGVYQGMKLTGWQGLIWAPLKAWVNYYDSFAQIFINQTTAQTASIATPDGLIDAIKASAQTDTPQASMFQAATKIIWDNALCNGVYAFSVGNATASYVHDDGFQTIGDQLWTPEITYMDKH
jgi:ABC-type transport system substrate-binding protein